MGAVHKAEFYIGKVKRTKNQKKKHISQMTKHEIAYLRKQIKLFPTWKAKASKHLKRKRVTFDINDIEETLLSKEVANFIIEYNETFVGSGRIDRRILVRSSKPQMVNFRLRGRRTEKAIAQLCFIISLDTYEIITVFWNKVSDNHETINWRRYNKHLRILK